VKNLIIKSAIIILLLHPLLALSQQKKMSHEEYIKRYKSIAIEEMHDYGVPASITLAQGLLESGSGNSKLAQEAKNHFGIKCHVGWKGDGFYMDDDTENECFRVYDTPEESYRDHSAFLRNRGRYSFLFEYKITDYKKWAHGLKKAGYATNPKYPTLLISLIERYSLHEYDKETRKISNNSHVKLNRSYKPKEESQHYFVEISSKNRKVYANNNVRFIYAKSGDNYYIIAEEFDIYPHQILNNNELSKKDKIEIGEVIYIEKKKTKADSKNEYHIVKDGESMRSISQRYAVRMKTLYKKNRMTVGDEPIPGQKLWLRKKKPKN